MARLAQVVSISKTGFHRAVSDILPLAKAKQELEAAKEKNKSANLVLKDDSGAILDPK